MKPFYVSLLAVLLLPDPFGILHAQGAKEKVCINGTEQFNLKSINVPGETFNIRVAFPLDYSRSQKSYPLLVLLDGDAEFSGASQIAWNLGLEKDINNIIVIGIGYGQGLEVWYLKRNRDLTPTFDSIAGKSFPGIGGAENFYKFIRDELLPYAETSYRINKDSVSLFGHSLGGLFASYVLFKHPEMFNGYIIGSPSLWWDHKYILKLENEYHNNHSDLNKTVYFANGSLEDKNMTGSTYELVQSMQKHNYRGLALSNKVFEDETHISVITAILDHGMRALFKRK
ncbi:MAG TPA: alpha/beta hydrolase-fold protein [Bacteroidales bacterium]|nr:alpha/beta hydrolase-fold protein [Bacteroidales bacterium]